VGVLLHSSAFVKEVELPAAI